MREATKKVVMKPSTLLNFLDSVSSVVKIWPWTEHSSDRFEDPEQELRIAQIVKLFIHNYALVAQFVLLETM